MDKHLAERQETGYEYKTQVFSMEKDYQWNHTVICAGKHANICK